MCPSNKQGWSDKVKVSVMQSHCMRSYWGCIVVDQWCRESNGKAKIEGYTRVSDEQAHQCGWPFTRMTNPYSPTVHYGLCRIILKINGAIQVANNLFEAMGGAPRKWCGIHWPALYSTATSMGGCGSKVAWYRGLSWLETVGTPREPRIVWNVYLKGHSLISTMK